VTALGAFTWTDVATADRAIAGTVRAGVDRVELQDFQRTIDVAGQAFLDRVFTPREMAFCTGRVDRLATRFAAKEAVAKVFSTGIRGLGWLEVEVDSAPVGEPRLRLHARARDRANALGITSLALSLTHTTMAAEAFVVALCTNPDAEQSLPEETNHG
jgi:holo-[acyl-carrier protein] synthase